MTDFYTENPGELLGRPKETVARYVESQGILVPRRFETLEEALATGVSIIARSEHPQDYDGVSGLLNSPIILPSSKATQDDLIKKVLAGDRLKRGYKEYCDLMGITEQNFLSQVSVSFWERLRDRNLTVVADNTIKGRYHIMVNGTERYYVEADNGTMKIIANSPSKFLSINVNKIIDFYERVRQLHNFNPSHSYVMELQETIEGIHFLQIHVGRDFNKAAFGIERAPKPGEYEANLVRGATKPDGETFKTVIDYGKYSLGDEEGSAYHSRDHIFQGLMHRKTGLQVVQRYPGQSIPGSIIGHNQTSQMFKPRISVLMDSTRFQAMVPFEEYKALESKARETQQNQYVAFRVVSDGRVAYISRA